MFGEEPYQGTTTRTEPLSAAEGALLLRIARRSLEETLRRGRMYEVDLASLPPRLQEKGASFVTLTQQGTLRGCIGSAYAHQPLALDVRDNAVKAALADPRFPPMRAEELDDVHIEVSVLSPLQRLTYDTPDELLAHIEPGRHGVFLVRGSRRALLLPQVWEKLPDKVTFLEQLALKAGLPADAWRDPETSIYIFEVQEFHERKTAVDETP